MAVLMSRFNLLSVPPRFNSGFAPLASLSPQAGEGLGARVMNKSRLVSGALSPNPSPACGRGEKNAEHRKSDIRRVHEPANRCDFQRGFTYLWVLLLVMIMGLGLTVASDLYATSVQRDKEKELLAIGRQFRTAIGRYHDLQRLNGKPDYPASLEDLLRDNRLPGMQRHLRKIFVDPMTGKAEWRLLLIGGKIAGVHSLSDKTPIKQDHFEADDSSFRGKQKYSEWVFSYPSDLILRSDSNLSVPSHAPSVEGLPDGSVISGTAVPTSSPAENEIKAP
jgi:type II secretory pathway pseudopilin PulG